VWFASRLWPLGQAEGIRKYLLGSFSGKEAITGKANFSDDYKRDAVRQITERAITRTHGTCMAHLCPKNYKSRF